MACEICGRNSCTKSFHSIEEQQEFEGRASNLKENLRKRIEHKIDRLTEEEIDGECYVKLDEVKDIIDRELF